MKPNMNDRELELGFRISSLLELENIEAFENVVNFTDSMNYEEKMGCNCYWSYILEELKLINKKLPTSIVSDFQALDEVLNSIKSFNSEGRIASQMPNFLKEFLAELKILKHDFIRIISNEIK